MSYSDKEMGRERLATAGLVVLVEGAVIAALVSGLAMTVIPRLDTPLTTYAVPEDKIPPVDKIKPQPETHARTSSEPVSQAPVSKIPVESDPGIFVIERPPVDVTPLASGEPPRPAPSPANLAKGATPRGNVGEWFPQNSYPVAALRAGAEGRVGVALTVSPTGRANGCEVVSTSGNGDLDRATCQLALRNARFQPARDQDGNAVAARIVLPSVRWRIER